tara:strand:- start:362 stop:1237 length:876 start_codon:yes stop_codon:yes gene_type:complete
MYLKKLQKYNSKEDEMFVPPYMGNWIYSSINQNILTSTKYSKNTKVLYMYHQFGIPQKIDTIKSFCLDKNLVLIEDCAHVLSGFSKKNKLEIGNKDNYVVYSFSKFLDCNPLGGLKSSNKEFLKFVDREISNSSLLQSYLNFLLIKISKFFGLESKISKKFLNLNYSIYHFTSKPIRQQIKFTQRNIDKEINFRKNRFNEYKNIMKEFEEDYFVYDELAPFKIPISMVNENEKNKIIKKFDEYRFQYDDLMFDKNRNMLDPNYIKTLVLDTSSKNTNFFKQIELIQKIKND